MKILEMPKEQIKPKTLPKIIQCENCGAKLEIEENDIHIGPYGGAYVKCPICCNKTTSYGLEDFDINLTIDNIVFPDHFWHTQKDADIVDIKPDEIKESIKTAIEWFRLNPNEPYWYTEFGNLFMIVFNYYDDNEYVIHVTKDYYDTYIPYESEDYKIRMAMDVVKDDMLETNK